MTGKQWTVTQSIKSRPWSLKAANYTCHPIRHASKAEVKTSARLGRNSWIRLRERSFRLYKVWKCCKRFKLEPIHYEQSDYDNDLASEKNASSSSVGVTKSDLDRKNIACRHKTEWTKFEQNRLWHRENSDRYKDTRASNSKGVKTFFIEG